MGTRPLLDDIALTLRVPRGQAGFWTIINDLAAAQGTFTIADIDSRSCVHRSTVGDYVRRLAKAGYLCEVGRRPMPGLPRDEVVYCLVRTAREAPRLTRAGRELPEPGQETLWRTMKMLGRFDLGQLFDEVTAVRPMPRVTVQRYCAHLAAAGVLKRIGTGRRLEYVLARNVGGLAPRILRAHVVFDPNSGTVIGAAEARDVA